MHIVIDIRALQTSTRQQGVGRSLRGWLEAFLRMPYEHRVTLLVDPRFDTPDIDVPLSGEYWHTVAFESCPHGLRFPSLEVEHLARQSTEQFLLDQEADLFHMPSPFERAVATGYPPTTCRSIVTFYDALPDLFLAESLAEGGESYAIAYYAKLRALSRCSRVVALSQSAADDLVRLTDVPADRIDVIHLAPSSEMSTHPSWEKAALACRQTYERALASPHPIEMPGPESTWTAREREAVSKLFEMADVADREYVVRSRVPGVGRWIAMIRYNMTTHLREAYFDPIVEQQVAFNLRLSEAIRAAWQMLKDRAEEEVLSARVEPRGSGLSQEILESASRAARESPLLNADLLAGPLPEFGEALGREFYHKLHTTSTLSMPPVSESQKLANANMITDIHKLARRIENKRLQIAAYYVDAMDSDVVLRDYQVCSEQRFIGPLIVWVRRNLTSHIREAYVDPILERQVTFNRLLVACLCNVNAINLLALAKMKAGADILLRGYRVRSKVPAIGPLIAWVRKNLTSHLREPYIDPIFERQVVFNRAAIDLLRVIHHKVTDWHLREYYDARANSMPEIKEEIVRLCDRLSSFNQTASPGQAELNGLLSQLLSYMDSRVEELS